MERGCHKQQLQRSPEQRAELVERDPIEGTVLFEMGRFRDNYFWANTQEVTRAAADKVLGCAEESNRIQEVVRVGSSSAHE